MKKIIFSILAVILVALSLVGVKAKRDNLTYYQDTYHTELGGPFESTGSTSRYALTETIVENKSVFFSDEQARASAPDITKIDDKVISIFTPGVSIAAIPFYILGKNIELTQITTYMFTFVIAILNIIFISRISRKLGISYHVGIFCGLVFLLATNALIYAFTLTQHHLSTLILLIALDMATSPVNLWRNIAFSALYMFGITVDLPNAFALLPSGFYIFFRNIEFNNKSRLLKIRTALIGLLLGLVPVGFMFGVYNKQATGEYYQLAQIIGRSDYEEAEINIPIEEDEVDGASLPLETRAQLRGLYILVFSNQRGIIVYNSVMLFGFFGLYLLYKNKEYRKYSILMFSSIIVILTLYSMHGDPWGGWSFGTRYSLPISAILAIAMGIVISKYKTNYIFTSIFLALLAYGIFISLAGVLTTTQVPPKVEAEQLVVYTPYTYKYNFTLLKEGFTRSLLYGLVFEERLPVDQFAYYYFGAIFVIFIAMYYLIYLEKEKVK